MNGNDFVKFGRWVTPVLEYETWLDWCETPEARKMGIFPEFLSVIVIDGNHFHPKNGVYEKLVLNTHINP